MEGRGLQPEAAARVVVRPEDLTGAARLPPRVANPRSAVCLAASWMLRADVAELWEPGREGLALSASTQEDRFLRPPPAIAAEVVETGGRRTARGTGEGGAILVEPVQRGRRTVAALL